MTLRRGDVIDRYRLEAPLGVGAFGEVWKASQLANGESVGVTCAIKVLKLSSARFVSSSRTFANGWLDEVRNLVRVADDTIPRILEADIWNGHAYIAMELLDGITLGARLAQGPIPWRRALFIADQIAKAIEAAHQLGVIHRDLKPQNVMLAGPRRVCVVDWGIARLSTATTPVASDVVRQSASENDTTDARPVAPIVPLHLHRAVVGTPGYMAPEVYDGAHPAPEQDIYALGVVLYEMIAGCLPHSVAALNRSPANADSMRAFRASLERATMDYAMVSLRERCPDTPIGVIELVEALLARDPAQRPTKLRNAIDRANRFPHGVPDPPYPGLGTLGPGHAGFYFGQQDAIQHVLERLRSQRAALLWGPSGSGKSSLALAGAAATMDRTLFLDTDGWNIHVVRPREGQGFRVTSDSASSRRPRIGQVIVVDQLEEIVDVEPAARDVFCAAVLALLDRSAPVLVHGGVIGITDQIRVIATIRDDLEWRVDREVPALRPLLERRIIVNGVDANFASSIIEEPARACGYDVEGVAAASREVEERLSMERAKLPMVQYALSEWWERRDRNRKLLPAGAWNEIGGVDGALSSVAERLFSTLDHGSQQRVKALFIRLFQGGRKQPLAESMLTPQDRVIVEQLVGRRLVGRREKEGNKPFYEAEHEYLSANWPRLADWLAEARDDQALVDELERDAAAYARSHDRDRLWRKRRLAAAVEMIESGNSVLTPCAQRFLQHAQHQERRGRTVFRGLVVVAVLLVAVYIWMLNASSSRATRALEDAEASRARAEAMLGAAKLQVETLEAKSANAKQEEDLAEEALRSTQRELAAVEQRLNSATRTEATATRRQQDMNQKLIAEQIKAQDLAAISKAAADQSEQRVATAEGKEKQADALARLAGDAQRAAEIKAAAAERGAAMAENRAAAAERGATTAERRAGNAEVKARQAEYRERKATQAAIVYEMEVRRFRDQLKFACVR